MECRGAFDNSPQPGEAEIERGPSGACGTVRPFRHLRAARELFSARGKRVACRGVFDNSPHNLCNPDDAATVHFGELTSDEMFIGYVNYAEIP